MEPMTMALIQAIPALTQMVTGLIQGRKANQLAEGLTEPTYSIPESARQALGNAQNQTYSQYMAGQGNLQNEIEQRYADSASDVLKTATSGADALAAMVGLNKNALRAQNQLGLNAAQDFQARQANYRNELNRMAEYEDKAFDMNEMQPFLRDSAAISALQNAKMNNVYQGIKGLSNVGSTAYTFKAYEDALMPPSGGKPVSDPTNWANLASLLASGASGVYSGNASINNVNKD